MSRTDLDPATLARSIRRMSGDGSVEWVMEPIQASVLHDVADLLDENAKLRKLVRDMWDWLAPTAVGGGAPMEGLYSRMAELGVEP